MKCAIATVLLTSLGLAACSGGAETSSDTDAVSETDIMEGGGAYPSPSASLAVEPLATDPAVSAAQNEARNMAPSAQNSAAGAQAQPGVRASAMPSSDAR